MAGADDIGLVPTEPTIAMAIRARFEDLTRAERQLADTLMNRYPMAGLVSITDFADAADVSTPTVVRMVKKLGFSGFPEFQARLLDEVEAQISGPIAKYDLWAQQAPETHALNRFAEATVRNLRQTLEMLDHRVFDAAVALLADADRCVHSVGGRITHSLAEYLFTHLQVIRGGVVAIPPNSNTWPHYVLNMAEGDIVVMFDIRRYEQELIRLAETATARGGEVVLFTDQWGSPAARHARHVFNIRVEAPSAWDSAAAILTVAEALIAAVQTAIWGETRERMEALESLFDGTGQFRKFT